jgi:hypothetical protein
MLRLLKKLQKMRSSFYLPPTGSQLEEEKDLDALLAVSKSLMHQSNWKQSSAGRQDDLSASVLLAIKDLMKLGVFKVLKRPLGPNVIGSTWAHRFKYGPSGELLRA